MYKILCVGKIKEKFLTDGILEYKKELMDILKLTLLKLKSITLLMFQKILKMKEMNY